MENIQLFSAYVANPSDEIFSQLVRSHIDLVYSAALRQTRDPHVAEDVTQAVFMILARKARHIRNGDLLTGWLVSTTRYAALNALKTQSRRRQHEQQAAIMVDSATQPTVPVSVADVRQLLDEALSRLNSRDRSAIALRYLEGQSVRDVGMHIGVSEQAAQKRISRALEKLRGLFARRGIATPADAVEASITQACYSAPVALASLITRDFLAQGALTSTSTASTIADETMKILAVAHAKLVAGICVCVASLLVAGTTALVLLQPQEAARADATPPPATAPASAPAQVVEPIILADDGMLLPNVSFTFRSVVSPNPNFQVGIDAAQTWSGDPALLISSNTPQWGISGLAERGIDPATLRGKRIRFSAMVKSDNLANWGSLRLQAMDATNKVLVNDDMCHRSIQGTTDWKRIEIVADIPAETSNILLGLHLMGSGKIWLDNAKVETVGQEVAVTDDQEWHAWSFSIPHYSVGPDPAVQRNGHPTVLLHSTVAGSGEFATWNQNNRNPDRYLGKRIRMTAWVKTEDSTANSGLWLRLRGPDGRDIRPAARLPIRGTSDWAKYEVIAEVPPETASICTGVRLYGRGKLWVDDVQYELLDAVPVK